MTKKHFANIRHETKYDASLLRHIVMTTSGDFEKTLVQRRVDFKDSVDEKLRSRKDVVIV